MCVEIPYYSNSNALLVKLQERKQRLFSQSKPLKNLNRQMFSEVQYYPKSHFSFLLPSCLILKMLMLLKSIQFLKINHSHADYFK